MSMRKESESKIRAQEVRRLKQGLRVLCAVCKGLFRDQQQCVSIQNLSVLTHINRINSKRESTPSQQLYTT